MWYLIIGEDIPNSLALRQAARPAHIEALQRLRNQGRLLTAGPIPAIDSEEPGENGFTGTVLIAEFESLSEAETWVENDPYVTQGVFAKVTVKPFKKVF